MKYNNFSRFNPVPFLPLYFNCPLFTPDDYTKLYPVRKWETNIRQQCLKNNYLSDYIYAIATFQCKACLNELC